MLVQHPLIYKSENERQIKEVIFIKWAASMTSSGVSH